MYSTIFVDIFKLLFDYKKLTNENISDIKMTRFHQKQGVTGTLAE